MSRIDPAWLNAQYNNRARFPSIPDISRDGPKRRR